MGKNSLVKHIYICDGVQKNFDYQFESFSKTSINACSLASLLVIINLRIHTI